MISNLSAQQLRHAASIKEKIDALEIELKKLLGENSKNEVTAPKGRRKMSAAARAKIAAAQKARWAKLNGKKPTKREETGRRKMSLAARAKIAAAAKARWAKVRAAGKKSL